MSSFRIRRAEASDLADVVAMAAALARQHVSYDVRRFRFPDALDARLFDFFAVELTRTDARVLVAEQDCRLVGYAYLERTDPSFVDALPATTWLHDLYVDAAARGAGVGAALVQAAELVRCEFGTASLHLTVSPANTKAQALFSRAGFRVTMIEMQADPDTYPA